MSKTRVLTHMALSPQHFTSLRLCFFNCKMGLLFLFLSKS